MKKLLVVLLTLILVVSLSVSAFGLMSPAVTKGHGAVTGMFASDPYNGLIIGGEFGITSDFGVGLEFGNNITKLYAKYELNPSIALTGGVLGGGGSTNPFIGINGGTNINRDLMVMGEVDLYSAGGNFGFGYEVGVKYNIIKELDIRGGARGVLINGASTTGLELGVGYKF